MAGERSERLTNLANQAAARFSRRLMLVQDLYASKATRDATVLTLEEIMEEFDAHGHFPPGEGCQEPTCVKARNWVMQAIQMMQQEPVNAN
jgi:hypothetical protein